MRTWLNKRFGEAESGLTMIEVLVAAVVLVMGAAAAFGVLGAATRNAQRAKSTQVALDLAQEEMERLHSISYEEIAVNSMPVVSTDEKSPNSRVTGSTFALHRKPKAAYFPLDVNAEKGFSPASEFRTGDSEHGGITGTIYRYVVWRNDPSCTTEACEKSEQDYKQIVVAVKPNRPVSQGGESGYVEVQSAVIPPHGETEQDHQEEEERKKAEEEQHKKEEEEKANGVPGSDVTAQQFFLSDTACAANGATVRQEISGDHLLHNTLGTCASGLQTGSENVGAPDALMLGGPPDPFPEDEALPYLYDYSDDFYLEPTPDTDKGVQIRRDDTSGCHYDPTGVTHPESQVHRWATDPMPQAFEMSGKVTLEFYTRTLNDALYTGTLCVYLFERQESGPPAAPVATDTMLIDDSSGNPYWTYEPEGNGYWPRNSWVKVRLTMEFREAPQVIATGDRLGVALSVDRANTPADAIPIMYDHPNYASRLEVDTKTPLESTEEEVPGGGEQAGG
jgi:type II secretory pathway pseudopilin PulG